MKRKVFHFSPFFSFHKNFLILIREKRKNSLELTERSINGNNSIKENLLVKMHKNDVNKLPHFTTQTQPDMSNKWMVLFGNISLMMEYWWP